MSIWNSLWKPPHFEDTWRRITAVFLHRVIILLVIAGLILSASFVFGDAGDLNRLPALLSVTLWAVLALFVLNRRYVQGAAYMLVIGVWIVLAYLCLTSIGVYSPGYYSLIILIVLAGTTINNRAVALVTLANILLGLAALWLDVGTHFADVEGVRLLPVGMWLFMTLLYIITAAMVVMVRRTILTILSKMRRDAAFYRAIVNDQTEHIVRWQPDGIRTFVNDAYCRYFGITQEQAIGTSFLPLIHEDDRERIRQKIARLSPTNPLEVDDQRVLRPDGTVGWQQWADRVLYDEDGILIGYQSVGRDITAFKELEIRERELVVTQEREAILRDFLSTISHDLQTPLSVMRTNIYMARKDTDSAKRNERLDRIEAQINRLNQMIGDILTAARLENIPALNLTPAPLQTILNNTVTNLQDEAKAKQITLDVTAETSEIRIQADEPELQRAFTNLVQNAIKYTPDGGKVRIGTQRENGRVFVEIVDTGIGISAEDLPYIFDRFYRANNAKDFDKGTGLGLAITKRIIELHAGKVEAASQPGHGTTFKVQLPLLA